jgi:uncharacterized membrane protein YbhN (UPF0104 family)
MPRVRPWMALGLGLLVILGVTAMGDLSEVAAHMGRWPLGVLVGVFGLSLVGYGVRTVRWMLYLGRLNIALPMGESVHIFLCGLVGSITPAKVGEVLKSFLIERSHGIPIARTAPIVLAERVGDLLALVLLAGAGVLSTGLGLEVVLVAGALAAAVVLAAVWPAVGRWTVRALGRIPGLGRLAPSLEEARVATQELFGTWTLVCGVGLSLIAWSCEALGTWWLITSLPGAEASLPEATFVFATSTVAGALTFLPGGLLATEGSMVGLLHGGLGLTPDLASAGAITLMVRASTLWFGVALGGIALSTYTRRRLRTDGHRQTGGSPPEDWET